MKKLLGKTTFITGATSGIGAATAKLFSQEGSRLILCGRRQAHLERIRHRFFNPLF